MEKVLAWWFAASDILPHGDGRKVVVGETHSLKGGIIKPCVRGLHGSEHPFDALQYANGPYLYRTEHWDSIKRGGDKLASRHRKYLAMVDVTPQLRQFAREQALSVIHLWDAPELFCQYLETGDKTFRSAAWSAAGSAAESAAESAARQRFAEIIKEAFKDQPGL